MTARHFLENLWGQLRLLAVILAGKPVSSLTNHPGLLVEDLTVGVHIHKLVALPTKAISGYVITWDGGSPCRDWVLSRAHTC